ncbi:MAG: YgaP family membrane protein [Pseudoalteromonas spongiae]|uniref:DUF2892 domain-containing protein n=1 Tax=Pseudoalteromonas spongiae TaxID=298657 RepID=A0ABU8EUQ6_9GAMM|nr:MULTISPECIES: DUF2892 domain-containing protein [Pseudoalteromonas]ATC99968.1 hypothetical protein PSPO_a3120 [Pseudoalteromonas spongiae UST010723-006]KPV98106.1 hypothetical protein AN214_00492 [Pseudoalteromonas sp. P1-9]MEC8328090.1 DUF2892 domain-containing protein [Pseudomonadota bacterium]
MKVNDALRLIAGVMLIVSLLLTHFVHPNWIFFTLFIAVNLLQSAFTKWCPMMTILRKFGLED